MQRIFAGVGQARPLRCRRGFHPRSTTAPCRRRRGCWRRPVRIPATVIDTLASPPPWSYRRVSTMRASPCNSRHRREHGFAGFRQPATSGCDGRGFRHALAGRPWRFPHHRCPAMAVGILGETKCVCASGCWTSILWCDGWASLWCGVYSTDLPLGVGAGIRNAEQPAASLEGLEKRTRKVGVRRSTRHGFPRW